MQMLPQQLGQMRASNKQNRFAKVTRVKSAMNENAAINCAAFAASVTVNVAAIATAGRMQLNATNEIKRLNA